jgi:hypothetical protein
MNWSAGHDCSSQGVALILDKHSLAFTEYGGSLLGRFKDRCREKIFCAFQ